MGLLEFEHLTNDYNLFSADHFMAILITHKFTDQDFFWDSSPIFRLTHSPCMQKDPLTISHAVRVCVPFLTLFLALSGFSLCLFLSQSLFSVLSLAVSFYT